MAFASIGSGAFIIGVANIRAGKGRKADAIKAAQGSRRAGTVVGAATRCTEGGGSAGIGDIDGSGRLAIGSLFFAGIGEGGGTICVNGEGELTGFDTKLGTGGGVVDAKTVDGGGSPGTFDAGLAGSKSRRLFTLFFFVVTRDAVPSVGRQALPIDAADG